jgi:hypothetical protein
MEHPHANLMAEYAKDAKKTLEPWKLWQCRKPHHLYWQDLEGNPSWAIDFFYSRKLDITPAILLNNLEFSETLPHQYTWDELMDTLSTFESDGWRLPKKWELMLLHEEKVESHDKNFYWVDNTRCESNNTKLSIYFDNGNTTYRNTTYHNKSTKCSVLLVRSRLNINPEFMVGDLEYSEVLPDRYSWDILSSLKWPDKWRVPTHTELVKLYKQEPTSHDNIIYWADTSLKEGPIAWAVNFKNCDVGGKYLSSYCNVRLVRETLQPVF